MGVHVGDAAELRLPVAIEDYPVDMTPPFVQFASDGFSRPRTARRTHPLRQQRTRESYRYCLRIVSGVRRMVQSGNKMRPIAGAFPIQFIELSR
jgi:hypothetical protein